MVPVAVCLVALCALLVAERAAWHRGRALAKLTASSAFVWAALSWGAMASLYGQLLLVGLVLCWIGDALLLPAGESAWFKLGILAFLLAHLAYALACAQLFLDPILFAATVPLIGFAAWRALRWLLPHLRSDFRRPVVAYVAVISLMVAVALVASGSGGPSMLAIGAFGFALSDLSVARDRFVSTGFVNSAWGLPAYFLSQLALAYTVSQVPHAL
jgi:uncharacterized membrane protein YhhN